MIRNHKAISFAMALVFCLSFMAPLLLAPQAALAVTGEVISCPNVAVGNLVSCGTIHVEGSPSSLVSGTSVQIQLLDGATFGSAPGVNLVSFPAVGTNKNSVTGATYFVNADSLVTAILKGPGAAVGNVAIFEVNFGKLAGPSVDITQSGDVRAELIIDGTTYGPYVIAKAGSGSTTAVGLSHPSVAEGNTQNLGDIKITEDRAGVMTSGTVFSVTLPDYLEWTGAPTGDGTDTLDCVAWGAPYNNGSGLSTQQFKIQRTNTTVAGTLLVKNIQANIDSDCPNGDVIVTIQKESGGGTVSDGSAWIGVKGDYTVNVEQGEDTVPTIYAGQYAKKPGTIRVSETVAGSLVVGRSITFELPSNCYWTKAPVAKYESGTTNILTNPAAIVAADSINDKRKVTFMVAAASTSASEILIHKGEIAVIGDADPGEILVTVAGTAGVDGTVLVGNIAEPVTVNVDPVNDVIIGLKNEQAGTVTITEAEAGLFRANSGPNGATAGVIEVALPAGCSWTVEPTVEVTAGDLKIDSTGVYRAGTTLFIPVQTSSKDTPATLTISGAELTLDRTVPEGTLTTGVRGAALDNELIWYNADHGTAKVAVSVTTFTMANCVTPAPSESVTETYGTFTLGSSIYYVNGMAKLMDVAVFAQDGRIFVPQRFLGLALGIPDENIVWDQATQTATFTTLDGQVIVFTVGSNVFTVDGVESTMDVTPQVVDGRICLPVRFMVEALGGTVGWDQATQTAFFSLG